MSFCTCSITCTASPSDAPGQVERHHHRRELADVRDGQLGLALLDARQRRQAHLAAVGGLDVDRLQRLRAKAGGGLRLQHHAVLAGLGVDGRDLPLAEGVVQALVICDTVMPRRLAMSRSITRYTCRPLSCRSLATSAARGAAAGPAPACRSTARAARRPATEAELVLGAADPVLDGQVLHRLHEQADAHQPVELRLQAAITWLALTSRSPWGLRLISSGRC
jgi:hypothetical protein